MIQNINDFREAFSIGLQISNMQELSYDIELEQEAKKMFNCDLVKDGEDFNVVRFRSFEDLVKGNDMPDARRIMKHKEEIMKNPDFKLGMIYFLHPLDSKIGCVDLIEECTFPNSEKSTHKAVCLTSPKHTTDAQSAWKHGKPMSDCLNGKSDSGLCKAA
ncbi:hypothetical protein B9Z55_012252 [Caenorhabditis nigoni]|nr:hypothetical protein B9Z55_012252 [Caenorhabditis nigoni]